MLVNDGEGIGSPQRSELTQVDVVLVLCLHFAVAQKDVGKSTLSVGVGHSLPPQRYSNLALSLCLDVGEEEQMISSSVTVQVVYLRRYLFAVYSHAGRAIAFYTGDFHGRLLQNRVARILQRHSHRSVLSDCLL